MTGYLDQEGTEGKPRESSSGIKQEPKETKASLMAQMVKNLPAVQETGVRSLDPEDPLERGMATHFSFLAWRIPWTEESGGLQSMGSRRVKHDCSSLARACIHTHTHTHMLCARY